MKRIGFMFDWFYTMVFGSGPTTDGMQQKTTRIPNKIIKENKERAW